ncbi:MAG: YihY family inner membrane protein [Verrucomicrobia bacterium]|nr:YihY family inner membrane protein [Verrucomicrobiota bacterium]
MASDSVGKFKRLTSATQDFLEEKIDSLETFESAWWRRTAHFWMLVGKSFWRNRCPVRASALAYTTLLALIPMLAIAVSVTMSLLQSEGEKPIRAAIDYLVANVAPALNLEVKDGDTAAAGKRAEVVAQITRFIANIRSGTLGVTSTIALMFVAIGLLRTIEAAFNDIWGVTRGRGWVRSFVQYWAAITLGPISLALALGLTTSPHLERTARLLESLGIFGTAFLQLLPFVVLSLAFGLFYQFMPNTRVRWSAALAGGVVGGCLWQFNNLFNVLYASRVISKMEAYSKIYGSLSIIPLFLIGLYVSWLIVLFGAQVAYAFQNRQAYLQDKVAESVTQRGREFVALRIMAHVAAGFQRGDKAPSVDQLANLLGVPTRLISQILQSLLRARLVVEVVDRENGIAPARPLDQITAHQIVQALRTGQGAELATRDDALRAAVRDDYDRIRQAEQAVAETLTLEAMVSRAPRVEHDPKLPVLDPRPST